MIIQQDGKQMAELQDGNSFGEISLIDNTTRNAGIITILILPQFIQILLRIALTTLAFSLYISAAEGVTVITAPCPPPTQHTGRKLYTPPEKQNY